MNVTLEWNPVTKDTAGKTLTSVTYNIYRNGTKIATSTDTKQSDTVPDNSGIYTYQVSAVAGAEGAKSLAVTLDSKVTAPPPVPSIPETPTGLKVTINVTIQLP